MVSFSQRFPLMVGWLSRSPAGKRSFGKPLPSSSSSLDRIFAVTGQRLITRSSLADLPAETKRQIEQERQQLLVEASALTRSLYRSCIRSVRAIRYGNEHDERQFQEIERKMKEKPKETDLRLSMLSMMPPVDREDELRSRAEYYMQYAHENFIQESDCLNHDDLKEGHVARFFYYLRNGEFQRKWLLNDMQFPDPCATAFDEKRVNEFEQRAMEAIQRMNELKYGAMESQEGQHSDETMEEDDHDEFFDEDDEVEPTPVPLWFRNPRSG